MSREMGIIVLGLAVMIIPYLGVPSAWRTALLVLAGAALAVIGFLLRGSAMSLPQKKTEHHPFAESPARMSDIEPHSQTESRPLVHQEEPQSEESSPV